MRLSRVYVALALTLAGSAIAAPGYIWIEGENPVRHNTIRHNWYDSVKKNNLSAGEWLSHFAGGKPPSARYEFSVTVAGSYQFWIRANSVAGPRLSYQLDDSAFVEVDFSAATENINIASDGKPDMRFISWINAGKLNLSAGPHTITFKFHSRNNNHGAIDCFVLTQAPFMPRGALKPGERTGKANSGFFAWEPDIDPFTSEALIDLRYLNEEIAGQSGRVKATGNNFALGNGKSVKFWAANIGGLIHRLDHQSHIYLARHLAKRGVNLVRIHGGIYSQRGPAVNMDHLDDLHHFVYALKQQGIYAKISFYFPAWFRLDDWHKQGGKWPFMLLFFDPDMQKIYFNWADKLLRTPNPYTKLPLGKDPAVAMLEIQNEDSHFFWTFGEKNAPPERWDTLKIQYAAWLKSKYGSLEKTFEAWQTKPTPEDDLANNKLQLLGAWSMTRDGIKAAPKSRKRVGDQVRFLTENMRSFYQSAIARFRDYGYTGLVSCGNWRTADPSILGPLEQYCYTAGDVIDHHGYFDHGHKGEAASYSVRPGHTFTSQSALTLENANPIPYVEIDGHPNIISEIGWPMPNMYRAEWPFLTAAYGSLNGLDAICHFAIGSADWDKSVGKFPTNTPVVLGSFFATALIYRHQYVAEAPAVVQDNLNVEDLLDLQGSNVYVGPALDQLRAEQIPSGRTGKIRTEVNPAIFYAGRVSRSFTAAPADSKTADLTKYINHDKKAITSVTNQLFLDYAAGLATVNTPKAQGAAGFLGQKGVIKLSDVDISMKNDYGTVLVVA
ncbi:MAG: carbohydrate-binding protein, partial [Planctomycetota bacterium]